MNSSDRKLEGRTALVFGAGQTPGQTIGNGRATALLFAGAGARVVAIDADVDAAAGTVEEITEAGGDAIAVRADIADEAQIVQALHAAAEAFGPRVDVLHNNVGISLSGGDTHILDIELEAYQRVLDVNLTGMVLTCKHVLPQMRRQRSGSIICISSAAAVTDYPNIGYRTSKAGVNALVQSIAATHARHGIRANAILPGPMNTPMAIESRVASGMPREALVEARDQTVPLRGKMGTAWDVAHAALFLASDDAGFITGALLPVDGGYALRPTS